MVLKKILQGSVAQFELFVLILHTGMAFTKMYRSNGFYSMFTNVFFNFCHAFTSYNVFYLFVFYIYDAHQTTRKLDCSFRNLQITICLLFLFRGIHGNPHHKNIKPLSSYPTQPSYKTQPSPTKPSFLHPNQPSPDTCRGGSRNISV